MKHSHQASLLALHLHASDSNPALLTDAAVCGPNKSDTSRANTLQNTEAPFGLNVAASIFVTRVRTRIA